MHLLISFEDSKFLRAALLDAHDRCVRFFLWNMDNPHTHRLGDVYTARLVERDDVFGWIHIGGNENYPISIDKIMHIPVGSLLTCKITRLPLPDAAHISAQKGLKFTPCSQPENIPPSQEIGLIKRAPHELMLILKKITQITVETHEIAAWFRALTNQIAICARTNEQPLFEYFDVEEHWQELRETTIHMGDGSLYLDETPLGVIMDINTRGGRKDQINLSACDVIARAIAQRHLTGPIIIDFAAIHNKAEQQSLRNKIHEGLKTYQLKDVRVAGWTPLHHLELFRPRDHMSLTSQLKNI